MDEALVFSQQRNISSAFIDSSVKMGIAQTVLMVQDNLTECFAKLGCDGIVYREKYNSFWVFTKTKVSFTRRPDWREKIIASTFPVDNAGFKTHVNTVLTDADGKNLITANQEACVLDLIRHRPVKLSTVPYPQDGFPEPVFTQPFEKFVSDFTDSDFKYEHIIRSQQIDMSHHLNNIEYIKLALNIFDEQFLLDHEPSELEVHYTGESKEGQVLRVYSRLEGESYYIAIKETERSVFEMKIKFN